LTWGGFKLGESFIMIAGAAQLDRSDRFSGKSGINRRVDCRVSDSRDMPAALV
jgi:hypothetical protein